MILFASVSCSRHSHRVRPRDEFSTLNVQAKKNLQFNDIGSLNQSEHANTSVTGCFAAMFRSL
jgi:hypothetical protein